MARYAHQPLPVLLALPKPDFDAFHKAVSDLVGRENSRAPEPDDDDEG